MKNLFSRSIIIAFVLFSILVYGVNQVSASSTINKVDTISDLRSISSQDATLLETVQVLGYSTVGDGGGGPIRHWVSGAGVGTYTDDGGIVIVPTGGNGSEAWLMDTAAMTYITPAMFGADGSGDDTEAIQKALDSGIKTIVIDKTYSSDTLYVRYDHITIKGPGTIDFDTEGPGLVIAPDVNNILPSPQFTTLSDHLKIAGEASVGVMIQSGNTGQTPRDTVCAIKISNIHISGSWSEAGLVLDGPSHVTCERLNCNGKLLITTTYNLDTGVMSFTDCAIGVTSGPALEIDAVSTIIDSIDFSGCGFFSTAEDQDEIIAPCVLLTSSGNSINIDSISFKACHFEGNTNLSESIVYILGTDVFGLTMDGCHFSGRYNVKYAVRVAGDGGLRSSEISNSNLLRLLNRTAGGALLRIDSGAVLSPDSPIILGSYLGVNTSAINASIEGSEGEAEYYNYVRSVFSNDIQHYDTACGKDVAHVAPTGDTTPSVQNVKALIFNSDVSVTQLDDIYKGQIVTLISNTSALTLVADSTKLVLGTNRVLSNGQSIKLISFDRAKWYEVQ